MSIRRTSLNLLAISALAVSLAGCSLTATEAPSATILPAINGVVHGGQSPIQAAHVVLYVTSATATTYGGAATIIGTSTSDVNGNFAISPSATSTNCPSGQQAYITAAGGYQSGQSTMVNSQMLLMAALGDCKNISSATTVVINEITTVAAAYALSGFTTTSYDSTNSVYKANISAPIANNSAITAITATAPAGLAHAFLNAAALANYLGGTANTSITANTGGTTTTGTVPAVEINTLADVMQACVNSQSSTASPSTSCTSLFGFTPSISGVAPVNTLQAFIYLARNPYPSAAAMVTSTGLLSLVPSAGAAFQPYLSAAPTDWSISIVYNNGLSAPYWLALDMNDTAYVGHSTTSSTTPALHGISPYGVSVPAFASPSALASTPVSRGIAPDALGNIWLTNNATAADRFSASTGSLLSTFTSAIGSIYGAAVDAHNNVWFSHVISGSATNVIDEAAYNSTGGTWAVSYTAASTAANEGGYGISVDANQNIWCSSYYSSGTTEVILPNTGTAATPLYTSSGTAITATAVTVGTKPYSTALDASGNAWVAITGSNTTATTGLQEITGGASSPSAQTEVLGTTAGSNTNTLGTTAVQMIAIDGAGTIFIPDNNSSSMGIHMYSTTTSNTLSPANGLKSCLPVSTAPTTCGATSAAAIYNPRQLAVDSTGSVWAGITSGGVTQIIGVAAPSYPLLSVGKPGLSPGLTAVNPLP